MVDSGCHRVRTVRTALNTCKIMRTAYEYYPRAHEYFPRAHSGVRRSGYGLPKKHNEKNSFFFTFTKLDFVFGRDFWLGLGCRTLSLDHVR